MTDVRLDGQVAIVTGGGRGVGEAIARRLSSSGARVVVAARTRTEVDRVAAAIAETGGTAIARTVDVTDERSVDELIEHVEQSVGPISLLVNNAGRARAIGPIWEVDATSWWRDVEVNLKGTFLCSRAAVRRMIPRRSGRIVNLSSYAAVKPSPYMSGYAASKAGVLRLTEGMAASLNDVGIAVFAVSPGNVKTAMTDHFRTSETGQRWLDFKETDRPDRWSEPDRVAAQVVVLASGRADRLSGRFMHVTDDLDSLIARADEIVGADLYAVRLRK